MKNEIFLHGALRVEYRIQLGDYGENTALIASEQRMAGGKGGTVALALASLGASVRLSGNPIGDDSHGRFLRAQLENVPGLTLEIETRSDVVTPYAILVRETNGSTRTLLSPEAARLEGAQDYPALLDALLDALTMWGGQQSDNSHLVRLLDAYDASFGLLSLKEEWLRIQNPNP